MSNYPVAVGATGQVVAVEMEGDTAEEELAELGRQFICSSDKPLKQPFLLPSVKPAFPSLPLPPTTFLPGCSFCLPYRPFLLDLSISCKSSSGFLPDCFLSFNMFSRVKADTLKLMILSFRTPSVQGAFIARSIWGL